MAAVSANDGVVQAVVEVDAGLSVDSFISLLKGWTSAWIIGGDGRLDYWLPSHYACAVSPEDMTIMANAVASGSRSAAIYGGDGAGDRASQPTTHCHHIIITTSRGRLQLPLKFASLLQAATMDICSDMSCAVIEVAAMRNHMHLLCQLPSDLSLAQIAETLKARLYDWMQTNPHYRRVDPWSDITLAYTVSPNRISQESCDVLRQDVIHPKFSTINEMYYLYQKMSITYVLSLH